MSSSSYCPGLQSCLEPVCLVEPRVLRLKLAPSKSNISRSSTNCNPFVTNSDRDLESNKNADTGGWSFLQSITNNTSQTTTEENDEVYVPPNFKRSSSMLSEKSLEMCTEGLGSETGSEGSESRDGMAFLSLENVDHETRAAPKLRETRTTSRSVSFPPPLSSISGSNNVRVRPHREGGRLVLEAVTVSSCHVHLHAERTDGRLRLHLMTDSSPDNFDNEVQEAEYGEEGVVQDDGDDQSGDDEAGGGGDICGEELEGINGNVEGEMGMGKLARPGRCKQSGSSNEGLLNWEPFWVAT
ncbi:protein FANTASTIC FOUR 2-like [Populus alba x Populus x berolinensis]|nr:protein FANTASTIC FOUR 2-like [Populus alba x Populus x berolinensis]